MAAMSTDGRVVTDKYYQITSDSFDHTSSWRCTEIGLVGDRSRDGSIHATDEVFNAASHFAASLLSLLGSVLMIVEASSQGDPWKIVSFSIYGATLIFLFTCSTLHHGIEGPWQDLFHKLDYMAMYVQQCTTVILLDAGSDATNLHGY
jgi:predicted membrane channel-forming protein YqfA (hemolysin III family)